MSMNEVLQEMPWVVSTVGGEKYAVSSFYVQEMIEVPSVTAVPRTPLSVRGVINLRGKIIPLIDLRVLLGMKSSLQEVDELVESLKQREQDHRNWLNKLDEAVNEKKPFEGELNPHKCAFGKWYDSFTTDNIDIKKLLNLFDKPHRAIHGIGARANELIADGRFDEAKGLVEETRQRELSEMIELFKMLRLKLVEGHAEIAMVLKDKDTSLAITLDAVDLVGNLDRDTIEEVPLQEYKDAQDLLCGIARLQDDKDVILLLDADRLLNGDRLNVVMG